MQEESSSHEGQLMRQLYHMPLSPFCRKIRLVLAEKKIEVELVEERPWEKRMDYLRQNPSGCVPMLKLDEVTLCDSSAIFEYLEEVYPEPALLPKTATSRAEARRMTAWFDDKFQREVTVKLLYERVNKRIMKAGYPDSQAIKEGSQAIKYHLDYMDYLLDQRSWIAGDKMTIADFSAAAQLSCLDYISGVNWAHSAVVKDWYAKIKSRPAFRTLLADQVPGFPQPNHYADLDF